MLPTTHIDTQEDASNRQSNFVVLRTLETMVSKDLFQEILAQVSAQSKLPKRIDWTGQVREQSYDELKVNLAQVDANFLPKMIGFSIGSQNKQQYLPAYGQPKNLYFQMRQMHNESSPNEIQRVLTLNEVEQFERMKTVFGHAMIQEGFMSPIYNVKFDQTGQFIISGADDGIVKIWDKHTMILQGSLHSHQGEITDMDISRCNQYLVTSSKDGKIIVWDWKQCIKIDEILDHRETVNNIKFFDVVLPEADKKSGVKGLKSNQFQILVSCSEDGTIRVYDELAYLEKGQAVEIQTTDSKRRSSRTKLEPQKKERFTVTLYPEDYRPGAKNKMVDSVHVTKEGLVVGGNSKGEVMLWQLDLVAFKKQLSNKVAIFLGSWKKHQKTVHFCEFSPDGRFLFTGSVDGTAKIWNIQNKQYFLNEKENLEVLIEQKRKLSKEEEQHEGIRTNLGNYREKKSSWQCDCLTWSIYGRYAIAALSGKFEDDKDQEHSIIKVWDSFTGELCHDLAKENKMQLYNFTFVLTPHTKIEEILLTGSDGGKLCLWNLKTKQLIKMFLEYGIYSYDKYTMSDPYDGKFSPDGSSFVVSSALGSISLFACDKGNFKYNATRVEQFYPLDSIKENHNVYYTEEATEEPQVCGFSLIPYEVQPPSSLIGKFKGMRQFTPEEYQRNLLLRQALCQEEEKFIKDQLAESIDNAMFNNPNQQIVFQEEDQLIGEDEIIPVRRNAGRQVINSQNSFNLADSPIVQVGQDNDNDREGRRMLRQIRRAERPQEAQNGRRNGIQGRVNRMIMNPNIDPDNDLYDRDSDENFNIAEVSSNDEGDDEDADMRSQDLESSEDIGVQRRGRRQAEVQVIQETVRTNTRSLRAQRRGNNARDDDEEEKGLRSKRRQIRESSEDSANSLSSDDYDMTDVQPGGRITRGKLQKQRNRGRTQQVDLLSSDDQSINSAMLDDESEYGARRIATSRRQAADQTRQQSKKKKNESQGRNLRTRGNRVHYDNMDEESDSNQESGNEEEEKITTRGARSTRSKKKVLDESNDEDMFDQEVYIAEEQSRKLKGDEDYELIDNQVQLQEDMANDNHCQFCNRSDGPIIGPFAKSGTLKSDQEQLYFHQDCLEANNITFYNKQKNKWMNIGKALEANEKKPSMCERCGKVGATIKCQHCRKTYHGYTCSSLYMIYLAPQTYQCFQCRNRHNFDTLAQLEKQEYKAMKKQINRDWTLLCKQQTDVYIPQVGDEVVYMFQGHEQFINVFNCFFYCGDNKELNFSYPWKDNHKLEKPTACQVISIEYMFPSNKAMNLIKLYGRSMATPQNPEIIASIKLQTLDDSEHIFDVFYFPQTLQQFLVLRDEYEQSLKNFEKLKIQNQIVNQVFKKKGKDGAKYKVISIKDYEEPVYPGSNWQSLQCKLDDQYRLRERARRGGRREEPEQESIIHMSFWNLELTNNPPQSDQQIDQEFREAAINIIADCLSKKKEDAEPFIKRVPEQVAKDYREHIPAEMFFQLIQERLFNNYYRHLEQLFCDLNMIKDNADKYNGFDNPLSDAARSLIKTIKKQLEVQFDSIRQSYPRKALDSNSNVSKSPVQVESTRICINLNQIRQEQNNSKSRQGKMSLNGNHYGDHEEVQAKQQAFTMPQHGRQYIEEEKTLIDTALPQNLLQTSGRSLNRIQPHHPQGVSERTTPRASLNGDQDMMFIQPSRESRRHTRQNSRTNYNESSNDTTSRKLNQLADRQQEILVGDDSMLGKSTRSGRHLRSKRKNLNEDEFAKDSDFDNDDLEQVTVPTASRKRLRRA